jgi:type 1 glutamine amidotransferase
MFRAIPLLILAGLAAEAQPAKIKTLLITGNDVAGHDWRRVSPQLKRALEESGRFDVKVTEEPRGMTAKTFEGYDLAVLNYYDQRDPAKRWGEAAEKALEDFVRSGKGLVMFHFSTASGDGWAEYEKMSGGNWRPNNGHHSPMHGFEVTIRDREHPIMKGIRAKIRVPWDELYANLKWQPADTYHVLATAWDDHKLYQGKARQPTPGDGLDQPMMWTLKYGQGNVFATVLGHDAAAVQTPFFVATFTRGAEWAATGAVTIPLPRQVAEGGHDTTPPPRNVAPGATPSAPPADAIVLFDGRDLSQWTRRDGSPSGCKVENGEIVCATGAGDLLTTRKFRSAQIHLEFNIPNMPDKTGQLKGNSGLYLQDRTEIQLLDSFNNPTYATGMLGAIYDEYPPLVNPARKPGEWQTYDIIYRAPKCNERGNQLEPGRVTILANGVLIQDNAPIRFKPGMCEPGPLQLQDHSGFPDAPHTVMRFRNIWLRELD